MLNNARNRTKKFAKNSKIPENKMYYIVLIDWNKIPFTNAKNSSWNIKKKSYKPLEKIAKILKIGKSKIYCIGLKRP